LTAVETAIDEELARLLNEGPTTQELLRVKTQVRAGFIRGIERIGGFGGKSDALASSEIYGGSPDAYRKTLADQQNATISELTEVARQWLSDGVYVLEVHPFARLSATSESADRSRLPDILESPAVTFPELQRAQLSNGLNIVLAERHATPVVDLRLLINAGYASDQLSAPGIASLAMNMLDEGTTSRSSLEINEELALLGAVLGTGSDLDNSTVSLNALTGFVCRCHSQPFVSADRTGSFETGTTGTYSAREDHSSADGAAGISEIDLWRRSCLWPIPDRKRYRSISSQSRSR